MSGVEFNWSDPNGWKDPTEELTQGLDKSFNLDFGGSTPSAGTPNMPDVSGSWYKNGYNFKTGETWQSPLSVGVQTFGAAANAFLGYQQLKLGKSQLEQNKKIFNLNFGAQAQQVNRDLEDRQRRRVAHSGQEESVDSYMARNSIKAKGI